MCVSVHASAQHGSKSKSVGGDLRDTDPQGETKLDAAPTLNV